MSKQIPKEQLLQLWNQLNELSPRDSKRSILINKYSSLFGISRSSVYRQLSVLSPINLSRADKGSSRVICNDELMKYCRIISALKVRTSNEKQTHLSTQACIDILENCGVEINGETIVAPKGLLKRSTVDRYLKTWCLSYDHVYGLQPIVQHFEANFSNECWQFDFTPSDLKSLNNSEYKLYLGVAVDDKSGVIYAEYFEVSGEDTVTALKFLYNAISKKTITFKNSLCGIPHYIYTDNGAFARSKLYQRVLNSLGIFLLTHMPKNSDNRRVTARSKGKVERANRTIKTSFESSFHLQEPDSIEQANQWLHNFLDSYNQKNHRRLKDSSKISVWQDNLPTEGYREGCSWEQFCNIAREPEKRKVLSDGCISIQGERYQLSSDLAGLEVLLLYGVFDSQIFVEYNNEKFGPFFPEKAPDSFLDYSHQTMTSREVIADEIHNIAEELNVTKPFSYKDNNIIDFNNPTVKSIPFKEDRYLFKNKLEAKRFISKYLGRPLAELSDNYLHYINSILEETLDHEDIIIKIKQYSLIIYDSKEINNNA